MGITWQQLEAHLVIEGKQSEGSLPAHKSRFKILSEWLVASDLELTRDNFNRFIYELKKKDYKTTYLNGFIKTTKHLAKLLGSHEFDDYNFFDENLSPPTNTLTPEEIRKLAEVSIKYARYKDRKPKVKALIYFLGIVGSRITETLMLEWDDFTQTPKPMVHFRAEITKTKKERYCAIPSWLYDMIQKLPHDGKTVFYKIERTRFSEDLRVRAKKCGITKPVNPHIFRDSSINNKLFFKVPLEQVTSYHGHASPQTTYKYYVRIQAQDLAETLENQDPSFKVDQTYDVMCNAAKVALERIYNPMLGSFTEEITEVDGKKVVSFKFVKK